MNTFESKSIAEWKLKLKENYFPTLVKCWALWGTVNFFNFLFLKPQYRVLYTNVVSVFWNTLLSLINQRSNRTLVNKEKFL